MSLVHLTSNGQLPNQFSNHFSNGIQLGPYSEIALVGYSGNLAGEGFGDEVYEIVINKGANDKFVFYHSDLVDADDAYYVPVIVELDAGVYSPTDLRAHLQFKLNQYETISHYKGGWLVTFAANKYTITCGAKRATVNQGGQFINYSGGNAGVVNGGASSTITPYVVGPPIINNAAFIDTSTVLIGDSSQTVGTAGPTDPLGQILEFTTIGATTNAEIMYSLCMVPNQMATRMAFSDPENPSNTGTIEYIGGGDDSLDFAYGPEGPQQYGFCPHGLCIGPDGRVGIIEAKTQNIQGNMKDPSNWVITWTATNIDIGTPGVKKLGISCRTNVPPAGPPVIEYLVDNTGGGGWASIGTRVINGTDGNHASFRYSQSYYTGIVINPISANIATAPVITVSRAHVFGGALGRADEDITIVWSPYNLELAEEYILSGLWSAALQSNKCGQSLGFPSIDDFVTAATSHTTGIVSDETLGESVNNGEYSPLLITCPSLPITGYIGGAAGSTAPLLGIGRVRGNAIGYGFSSEVPENWIQMRNSKPIVLYQLSIDIKTETNTDYQGLEPNFSCWVKFRSNTHCNHPKQNDIVGILRS